MSTRRPLYRALFIAGVAVFVAACFAGLVSTLVGEGRLPGISQEYSSFVRRLLGERRYDRAAREMQMALKLDHTLSKGAAELALGQSLARSGQLDAAIVRYRAAIAAEPQNAVAHAELGGALAARGDFDGAVIEMRRGLEIDPTLPDVAPRLAWAEGCALRAHGRLEEAAGRMRAAIAERPDLVDARYDLGVTLAAAGRLDEAVLELQEQVRIRPDNRGYNALGMALAQLGRPGEAAGAFRRGLELAPGDTELRRNLARITGEAAAGAPNP
jgi:tetratricopeptide (TPR) repeat protein